MKAKLIPQEIIEDIASKQRVEWGLSETSFVNGLLRCVTNDC